MIIANKGKPMMKSLFVFAFSCVSILLFAKASPLTLTTPQRSRSPQPKRLPNRVSAHEKMKQDIRQSLAGQPLPGLFGMNFGTQLKLEEHKSVNLHHSDFSDWNYEFVPITHFRAADKYIATITPMSHRVWRVSTKYRPNNGLSAKEEAELVCSMFSEKFQKKRNIHAVPDYPLGFIFPDNSGKVIRVVRISSTSKGMVIIVAEDLEGRKLAEQEMDAAKRKKAVETIKASDVDAL